MATVMYRTCPDCAECKTNIYVPHYNCLYMGRNKYGHRPYHCTADSCY